MGEVLRCVVVVLAVAVAACGTTDESEPDAPPPPTPVSTVAGIGRLPATVPTTIDPATGSDGDPSGPVVVTRPVDDDGVVADAVAERVNGNRLLVIGDSILASTASRYGDEMCAGLTPRGWTVEVDAEAGRFVEFGSVVLEDRLPDDVAEADDWDAAIVQLGNNYGGDRQRYFDELNEILFRLSPRPTVLLTVTEYRPEWEEVNDAIRELAQLYDNVIVIDWAALGDEPGVLSTDGLHPTDRGQQALVEQLALTLGTVDPEPGECLQSPFTDDSAFDEGSAASGD